jgi:hypothetical protein
MQKGCSNGTGKRKLWGEHWVYIDEVQDNDALCIGNYVRGDEFLSKCKTINAPEANGTSDVWWSETIRSRKSWRVPKRIRQKGRRWVWGMHLSPKHQSQKIPSHIVIRTYLNPARFVLRPTSSPSQRYLCQTAFERVLGARERRPTCEQSVWSKDRRVVHRKIGGAS